MCGRYGLDADLKELLSRYGIRHVPDEVASGESQPRYNVAPTDQILVVMLQDGERRLERMKWGLVPSWAQDPAIGNRMINARAETVPTSGAFKTPFRRRRCVVPANWFYEWVTLADGKQPLLIRRRDRDLLSFAGLWDEWRGPGGPLHSFSIITTTANAMMQPIHPKRMPVILSPENEARWLAPETEPEQLQALLRPCADELLEAYPVTRQVNKAGFDEPICKEPLWA